MWATTLFAHPAPIIQWGVVIGASLAAAISDARSRRISNRLTLPLLVAGWTSSLVFGGAAGAFDSLAACLLLALPYVILFACAGGGAGDAKLMGALGAWLGLVNGAIVLFAVALAGTVFALGQALAARRSRVVLGSVGVAARGMLTAVMGGISFRDASSMLPSVEGSQKIPYGLAIFAGVVLAAGGILYWHIA